MKIDRREFTHYGRFYGVPVYLRWQGEGLGRGVMIAGRNAAFDWLVTHVCPRLHAVASFFSELFLGRVMVEFPIEVLGKIEQ